MTPYVRFITAVLACLLFGMNAPSQTPADALGDPLPEGAIARLRSYDDRLSSLQFSADGRKLFAEDLTIDTATWRQREAAGERLKQFHRLQAVSLDQALCIAADGKHEDAVFDVKSGRLLARLQAPARDPGEHGGFFSPSASHYVMQDRSCAGTELDAVFAIPKGKRLWQLSCNNHVGTWCWTFSRDESRVAFLETSTNTIHVRDMATGELLRQLGNYRSSSTLALSPSGNMLAVWEPGLRSVAIWNLRTGKTNRSLALEQAAKAGDQACLQWSADSRMLAVGGLDNSVRLWEVASGRVRRELCGHLGRASCLAFSLDGKLLASGSDTTLLIWKTFPERSTARDSAALWAELARDAVTAHRAMASLIAAPQQALPLLRERLRPAAPADPRQVARLISELDSEQFEVRENATRELGRLGELAGPGLRKALEGAPPLERLRRLDQLLTRLQGPVVAPDSLRSLRAVEVLEHLGGTEARRLLHELAKGAAEARLTREAKAALARLERR